MKESGFTLKNARSRRYPTATTSDAHHSDDIGLLANTPTQAKSLLPNLEQVVDDISFHVNSEKTEKMCFNQDGGPLKLVDKFTYLGSRVSFIESDLNICLAKPLTILDSLPFLWMYDLSDEMRQGFLPSSSCVNTI